MKCSSPWLTWTCLTACHPSPLWVNHQLLTWTCHSIATSLPPLQNPPLETQRSVFTCWTMVRAPSHGTLCKWTCVSLFFTLAKLEGIENELMLWYSLLYLCVYRLCGMNIWMYHDKMRSRLRKLASLRGTRNYLKNCFDKLVSFILTMKHIDTTLSMAMCFNEGKEYECFHSKERYYQYITLITSWSVYGLGEKPSVALDGDVACFIHIPHCCISAHPSKTHGDESRPELVLRLTLSSLAVSILHIDPLPPPDGTPSPLGPIAAHFFRMVGPGQLAPADFLQSRTVFNQACPHDHLRCTVSFH